MQQRYRVGSAANDDLIIFLQIEMRMAIRVNPSDCSTMHQNLHHGVRPHYDRPVAERVRADWHQSDQIEAWMENGPPGG